MKTLWLVMFLFLGASAIYGAYPDEYPLYLRLLGFSKDEIRDLQYGRFVTHRLKDRRPGEFGISAAKVLDVPGYFIRDYYSYVENFRSLRDFREVGKFQKEPELQDLAPLSFSVEELQVFAACPSKCSLNLAPEEIAAIQPGTDLPNLYRKILLNRVRNYLQNGNPNDSYLKEFPHLPAYFPSIVEYLAVYPTGKDRRIPDFFYWVREQIGRKNVIQIRHVFSQRVYEDFVLVDHLVYSNHSLLGSAFVLHLIEYVDGGHPRTLLVYHGRNFVDSETGGASAASRRIFSAFRRAGEELEERYLSRDYPGFPYELVPRDQR